MQQSALAVHAADRRNVARGARLDHRGRVRWFVYVLRCGDGSLYTGVTNDLDKRVAAHRSGRGARYTRGRGPLTVVRVETRRNRSSAQKRESAIKRLDRSSKLALLDTSLVRG
jgi:putative endonuclease